MVCRSIFRTSSTELNFKEVPAFIFNHRPASLNSQEIYGNHVREHRRPIRRSRQQQATNVHCRQDAQGEGCLGRA
jgi:hypothetical protein